MDAKETTKMEKLKYPRAIFFIITNEFCERFTFYGMRTVLTLYLRNQLNYSDNMATIIYHVFTMFVYFFPLFGAMLADSVLGKFRTILYLSMVYAIGQLLLSLTAIPPLHIPAREFSLLGLLLVALGTGGIKPCVSAFGGDQFVLPQQERYLSTFFSLFYFSINSGSLISSFLTPLLRSNVACFGENTCYSLAFFVPTVLMALSIVVFVLGSRLYKVVKPTGNVVLSVSKCISHAIYNKATSKGEKREHWLDHADDIYDQSLITDIKAALQVMKLFIPLPIFWALFDQQASRWTIQATRMDGEIGSYLIQPDQMLVINPFLVLALIPFFEACIYPIMAKVGLRTPLKKLAIGGFLAALSFVASALVEVKLEATDPILPSEGFAQLQVFNTLDCPIHMKIENDFEFDLKNLDIWAEKYIKANGKAELSYTADFTKCNLINPTDAPANAIINGKIQVWENKVTSWALTTTGLSYNYTDSVAKSKTGDPYVRGLIFVNSPEKTVALEFAKGDTVVLKINIDSKSIHETEKLNEIKPGTYNIHLNGKTVQKDVALRLGGVYTVVGSVFGDKQSAKVATVTEANSMHILWLVPQIIIITVSEVMFSVTGLEFAFTQAPQSMKSLLQAAWLLTVALGNLVVVIIAEVSIFDRQVFEYLLFAGLMFVDMIIFSIMAKFYKYAKSTESEPPTEEISMDVKNGIVNTSYDNDDK